MSDFQEIDFTVATHFIPAIINEDWTGLDEGEVLELTTFLTRHDQQGVHAWVVKAIDNEPELATCEISNLFSECETLTLLTNYHNVN